MHSATIAERPRTAPTREPLAKPVPERPPLSPARQYALDICLLIAVCAAVFFLKLGSFGIIDPGDGYYMEGAREMVESGNYLVPQLNAQVFFSKPILMFWLIAGAYHVFGINEFAARFWSAAFATALVLATYALGRTLAGRTAGWLAALVAVSTPLIVQFAHLSLIDMTFSALLQISLAAMVIGVFFKQKKWMFVFYAALSLSILTKGPAGLAFFAGGGVIWLAARRPGKQEFFALLKGLQLPWGLPLLALISVPWYCAVGAATNWLWPKVFFLYENGARFAGVTAYLKANLLHYLPVLGYAFAPWVVFLPHSIKAVCRDEWTGIDSDQRDGILFTACLAAAVILIFPFCGTQIAYNILPLMAPFAVLVGIQLDRWANKTRAISTPDLLRHVCLALAIAAPFGALAGAIALLVAFKHIAADLIVLGLLACGVFWVGLTAQYALLRSDRVRSCINTLAATFALVTALAAPAVFDITYRFMQSDLYTITMEAKQRTGLTVVFHSFNPSVMFYMQRPTNSVFDERKFQINDNATLPLFIIAQQKDGDRLTARFPQNVQILDKQGNWCLFLATHMTVRQQETLESLYSAAMDNMVREKDSWSADKVPYAAGVPPKENHFHKWL